MSAHSFTVTGISAEHFTAIEAELVQHGGTLATLPDGSIDIKGGGAEATATYDRATQQLVVNVTKKPFLATWGLVENRIREALGK